MMDKVTGHVREACREESTDSAFADTQNIPTLNRARSTSTAASPSLSTRITVGDCARTWIANARDATAMTA